jgi:tRNA1Val (adenine37-N6)-methyltransferase
MLLPRFADWPRLPGLPIIWAAAQEGSSVALETTTDRLLGGRVHYEQPRQGFRTGIEPVLLAASIPVRPGERVLEAGTGAGAASLCLAFREPACRITAVERNEELAALAAANMRANGFTHQIVPGDILNLRFTEVFDHAMANPPWHAADSSASADMLRDTAKRGVPTLYKDWVQALARPLRARGSLSLILPAAHLSVGLAALAGAECGGAILLPFWPRAARDAKLILLRATRGDHGSCRVAPGLMLHIGTSGYTEEATAVLRDGAALTF